MNDSRAMSKSQSLDEMGNGKRSAIVVLAAVRVERNGLLCAELFEDS